MHALHAVQSRSIARGLGHAIHVERALRHLAQEVQIVGSESLLRPKRRESGDRIEGLNAGDAGAGFIVIAADELPTELAGGVGDFVRAAAIADDIAQVDDRVIGRRSLNAGFHALQVGMDVADDEDAQSRPTVATLLNNEGQRILGDAELYTAPAPRLRL